MCVCGDVEPTNGPQSPTVNCRANPPIDKFIRTPTKSSSQNSSGSGCATAVLARTLRRALGPAHHTLFLATDVNPKAARATVGTGRVNGVALLDVVQGDLLTNVAGRLAVCGRRVVSGSGGWVKGCSSLSEVDLFGHVFLDRT